MYLRVVKVIVQVRVRVFNFTPPSDCSWSTECVTTTTMPNATTFFKNSSSFPRGYYVSTIANLPADPLSVVTGIGVDQAVETCSKMSNCTAFVFDGPASDEIQSSVSFFNTEIALAPDRLFSLWVYISERAAILRCKCLSALLVCMLSRTTRLTLFGHTALAPTLQFSCIRPPQEGLLHLLRVQTPVLP